MSIIFSGIKRIVDRGEENPNWEGFQEKDRFNCYGEKNVKELNTQHWKGNRKGVLLSPFCQEGKEGKSIDIEIFTESQRYCLNTTKKYILEHALYFVPRIFYTFKPDYAVQLSMRYILGQVTGSTEAGYISYLLSKNEDKLVRYFSDLHTVSIHVACGGLIKRHLTFAEDLNKQIILALIEVFNLQRRESTCGPMISIPHLVHWGDPNSLFTQDEEKKVCSPNRVTRGEKMEICMYTAEYICIICTQHFNTNLELKQHIESHRDFSCRPCEIQLQDYESLLAHVLTTCKAPCLMERCEWCKNEKMECICVKTQKMIYVSIENFLAEEQDNMVYNQDLFSMIMEEYCRQAETPEVVMQTQEEEEEQTVVTQSEVDTIVRSMTPTVSVSGGQIVIEKSITIGYSELKDSIREYFTDYAAVEQHILEWMVSFRQSCIMPECQRDFSVEHVQNDHGICVYARSMDSDEIPHRYEGYTELLEHYCTHSLHSTAKLSCNLCEQEFFCVRNRIKIDTLIKHLQGHTESEHKVCCPVERFPDCFREQAVGSIQQVMHALIYHTEAEEGLREAFENWAFSMDQSVASLTPGGKKSIRKILFADKQAKENLDDTRVAPSLKHLNLANNTMGGAKSFTCFNERHEPKLVFKNVTQFNQHLLCEHKCPVCTQVFMMDAQMENHMKQKHIPKQSQKCEICNLTVAELSIHTDRLHPKCCSCQSRFRDLQALRAHEPLCNVVIHEEALLPVQVPAITVADSKANVTSLNIDSSALESEFSQVLIKLLERSNCSQQELNESINVVTKFASESTITKNRNRLENVSIRKHDACFFDTPAFNHAEKSNLPKVLSSIGTIAQTNKFDGHSETAKNQAVVNFEMLDIILTYMEKNILLGALNEIQAVSVLQLYLSQRICDEIASYQNTDYKNLSYQQILSTLQYLYIPLNLTLFQNIVLAYRIAEAETFLEFSSRTYRHLKLCARLKAPEERAAYIERNRCVLLKQNVPGNILETIVKKEQVFRAFSSQEILDHVISGFHNKQSNKKKEIEQYAVFSVSADKFTTNAAGTGQLRAPKEDKEEKKTFHQKSYPTKSLLTEQNRRFPGQQRGRGGNYTANSRYVGPEPRITDNGRLTSGWRGGSFINRGNNSQGIRTNNTMGPNRADILKKFGIDPNVCWLCLGDHTRANCVEYKDVPPTRTMCVDNDNMARGFHSRNHCKHKQNGHFTHRPGNYNSGRVTRRGISGGNRSQSGPSKVFRPYKLEK